MGSWKFDVGIGCHCFVRFMLLVTGKIASNTLVGMKELISLS